MEEDDLTLKVLSSNEDKNNDGIGVLVRNFDRNTYLISYSNYKRCEDNPTERTMGVKYPLF